MSKLPFVAFTYNDEIFNFIDRKWNTPTYHGFDMWSIFECELYDFMY